MPKDSAEPKKGAPKWATEPFKQFLDYVEELCKILHLSMRGISMIRAVPQAVEAVAKVKATIHDEAVKARMERAKSEAEFAQQEVDKGFPVLHAQALVSLWGGLETLVRTFLATWLANEPTAMFVEPVRRLRVRLGEYESLDEEERSFFILDLLERDIRAPLRNGVSRFEVLFEIFGLSGQVDESDRKTLFEINHLRNVIVHRRGIADKRLIDACPWLKLKIGDPVFVSHEAFGNYVGTVHRYVIELITRLGVFFGVPRSNFRDLFDEQNARLGGDEPLFRPTTGV